MSDLIGRQPDCILTEFGECTYRETGCSDCKIKAKIRTALSAQQSIIATSNTRVSNTVEIPVMDGTTERLPSAQPEGEWLERKVFDIKDSTITEMQSAKCSKCGRYHTIPYMYFFHYDDYCPFCGRKMKGGK